MTCYETDSFVELTFWKAIELALAAETAAHNSQDLQASKTSITSTESLLKVQSQRKTLKSSFGYCCGGNHFAKDCQFREEVCRLCIKKPDCQSMPYKVERKAIREYSQHKHRFEWVSGGDLSTVLHQVQVHRTNNHCRISKSSWPCHGSGHWGFRITHEWGYLQVNLGGQPTSPGQDEHQAMYIFGRISQSTRSHQARPFMGKVFLVIIDAHLVIINAHSKWLEVVPVSSTNSSQTVMALRQLFATHGIPKIIVSDNGSTSTSSEFEMFTKQNGSRHLKTAPYHPSTNSLAERAVQVFKWGMKKNKAGELTTKLAHFLLHYRTTPQATTGKTPAELLMGRSLRTHLDMLRPNINARVESKQLSQKLYHDNRSRKRSFSPEEKVHGLLVWLSRGRGVFITMWNWRMEDWSKGTSITFNHAPLQTCPKNNKMKTSSTKLTYRLLPILHLQLHRWAKHPLKKFQGTQNLHDAPRGSDTHQFVTETHN